MAFLRISAVCLLALQLGCGDQAVSVYRLETDTYISNVELVDHSNDDSLKISRDSTLEQRGLVRLPTGFEDEKENMDEALNNGFTAVFFMPLYIIRSLLGCAEDTTVTPENLTTSTLTFTIDEGSPGSNIDLKLLSKPWWHTADWSVAHPFSSEGEWTTAGGDIDTTFATVTGSVSGTNLEFDITSYFRELLADQSKAHYGFLLVPNTDMGTIKLKSVQTSSVSDKPRLVSTYTTGCGGLSPTGGPFTYTLGQESFTDPGRMN